MSGANDCVCLLLKFCQYLWWLLAVLWLLFETFLDPKVPRRLWTLLYLAKRRGQSWYSEGCSFYTVNCRFLWTSTDFAWFQIFQALQIIFHNPRSISVLRVSDWKERWHGSLTSDRPQTGGPPVLLSRAIKSKGLLCKVHVLWNKFFNCWDSCGAGILLLLLHFLRSTQALISKMHQPLPPKTRFVKNF